MKWITVGIMHMVQGQNNTAAESSFSLANRNSEPSGLTLNHNTSWITYHWQDIPGAWNIKKKKKGKTELAQERPPENHFSFAIFFFFFQLFNLLVQIQAESARGLIRRAGDNLNGSWNIAVSSSSAKRS